MFIFSFNQSKITEKLNFIKFSKGSSKSSKILIEKIFQEPIEK
jgi:hypothetical protein